MSDDKKNHDPSNRALAEKKLIKQLDFLLEMYEKGIDLGKKDLDKLTKYGYINKKEKEKLPQKPKDVRKAIHLDPTKTDKEIIADSTMDIVEDDDMYEEASSDVVIVDDIVYSALKDSKMFTYEGGKTITKSDWAPKDLIYHTDAFVEWIDSINSGFQKMIPYKPFQMYCQQSKDWMADKTTIYEYESREQRREWAWGEMERIAENSLYFLDKYLHVKEATYDEGFMDYDSKPVHKVMAFMFDCGYSVEMGKPRQIAATTTIGGLALCKLITKKNFFIKMIAQDKEKVQEIFDDKIKYPYSELPEWMYQEPLNDRDNLLYLGQKKKKGKKGGVNSKIQVVAPTVSAINGGAPPLVLIDEGGYIGILGKMIKEARPTMFMEDPVTKKISMRRQIWIWGCVCAGTKVWNNKGELVNIEDLKQEDGILGYDGDGISKEPITWMKPPAKKECYRITVEGGDSIECSHDHPLMWGSPYWRGSYNKKKATFKRTEDIKVGDQLMMIDEVPLFGKKDIYYSRLLGFLIGDGNYSYNSAAQMAVADTEVKEYIENNFNSKVYKKKTLSDGSVFESIGIRKFVPTLKKHGMYGQSGDNKRLPSDIDSFNKKSIAELIGGYFDADGNVYYNKKKNVTRIVLTSICKPLLVQVKYQLIKFGLSCSIHKENRNTEDKISEGQKDYIYRLYIANKKDVIKFREQITFLCKHKQDVLDAADSNKKIFGSVRDGIFEIGENGKGKHLIGKPLNGIRYRRVIKVEPIGKKDIYNLTAGATHTYLANNFVTGNTGGEMDKKGKAYEEEFKSTIRKWQERDFPYGIIPLFFDWTTRPGMTRDHYLKEKRAYTVVGPESEEKMVQFRQAYPSIIEDMFLTSSKTLVPISHINKMLEKIRGLDHGMRAETGFFEPVYDMSRPSQEHDDLPYKLIGAEFVPCKKGDPRASAKIFLRPKKGWVDRYYQGTDPISTDNGYSNMAATIWDAQTNSVAGIVNYRHSDHKETFLQILLLGLYYDANRVNGSKRRVRELVESNIGTAYTDYTEFKGYRNSLVLRTELPSYFQGGQAEIGIDNRAARTKFIIHKMHEVISLHGKNIYIEDFWEQLSTFVCKITDKGNETWETHDKRKYHDDVLFSTVFSYICSISFTHRPPRNLERKEDAEYTRWELYRDNSGELRRRPVRKKIA